MLGKRKARAAAEPDSASDSGVEDAQAIFRRHFEAHFKPLPESTSRKRQAPGTEPRSEVLAASDDGSDNDTDSEWAGISSGAPSDSEENDQAMIPVIDHAASAQAPGAAAPVSMSKREMRAYLSSRPPDSTLVSDLAAPKQAAPAAAGAGDPEDSAALLANDLALQRLLAESDLLHAEATHRSPDAGRTRLRATDRRVQALGARDSLFAQSKMPMAMRRGIAGAATAREDRRRREARENGIVLERPGPAARKPARPRREAAVDAPAVGRMRGAELRVSERDVREIQGDGRRSGRGGRGGRKRR